MLAARHTNLLQLSHRGQSEGLAWFIASFFPPQKLPGRHAYPSKNYHCYSDESEHLWIIDHNSKQLLLYTIVFQITSNTLHNRRQQIVSQNTVQALYKVLCFWHNFVFLAFSKGRAGWVWLLENCSQTAWPWCQTEALHHGTGHQLTSVPSRPRAASAITGSGSSPPEEEWAPEPKKLELSLQQEERWQSAAINKKKPFPNI